MAASSGSEKQLAFERHFLEDLRHWVVTDPRVAAKILDLIDAIARDPTRGIGKPELLKRMGSGYWSRRITQEHRLVYRVLDTRIVFLQSRYHY